MATINLILLNSNTLHTIAIISSGRLDYYYYFTHLILMGDIIYTLRTIFLDPGLELGWHCRPFAG